MILALRITILALPLADAAGEEEDNNGASFEVGDDGGTVSVNQLPGHGLGGGNEPTYDPYTIGAKHGFGNLTDKM